MWKVHIPVLSRERRKPLTLVAYQAGSTKRAYIQPPSATAAGYATVLIKNGWNFLIEISGEGFRAS